jgi:ribose transport system permease protein
MPEVCTGERRSAGSVDEPLEEHPVDGIREERAMHPPSPHRLEDVHPLNGPRLHTAILFEIYETRYQHVSLPLVILAVFSLGIAVGFVNAFFVVVVRLSAFIATLGTARVLSGIAPYVRGGRILFRDLPASFVWIGGVGPGGIPRPAIYLLGVGILLWYLLEHTPFSRFLTAVGLGRQAARLAGVCIRGLIASSFLVSGLLASLAGLIEGSRLASATPTEGPDFLLPAFAAAFLGATTIRRGQFNVWGTLVGVFFLAIGIVGLQQLGAPFWLTPLFNGSALLVAVSLTYISARRRELVR